MADTVTNSSPNKMVGMVLGGVLVLVGLLGFVPGLAQTPTSTEANDANDRVLLGAFGVNAVHNIVHLLTGAILLAGALMDNGRNARMVNMGLGGVYLVVALIGFLKIEAVEQLLGGDVGIAWADPILHLVLAGVLLGVALAVKETLPANRTTPRV